MKVGNRYKVYIEDANGNVVEVPAIAASLTVQSETIDTTEFGQPFRTLAGGQMRTRIELEADGAPTWIVADEWRNGLRNRLAAPEWKCDYCGRPNARERETCKSCGAVRSFIYGVQS